MSEEQNPTGPNTQRIVISSEDDAFRYLQTALDAELKELPISIEFNNWPILTISLDGKGYDSTITPHMAMALVELQHAMNRTYARLVRNSHNANVLTNEQKQSIEFKAKVEKGSSLVSVDLGQYAQTLATELVGKMDGTQLVTVLLGTAITAGSVIAYKSFLKHRSEDKKVDLETQQRIALSKEETNRMEVMRKALATNPMLAHVTDDFDDARHTVVKGVGDASSLKVQGIELSNSEAKTIASTPRTAAEEIQLNGHYRIDKIDWTKEDEVRISLWSLDQTLEFVAKLSTLSLTDADKEKLKAAEWDRQRLYLQINATRLRGQITTATIVGVEWPKDKDQEPAS